METLFWFSLALVVYVYIGYPVVIKFLAAQPKKIAADDTHQPTVSILIAAFNEEKEIESTIRNKMALDYPAEKLEIIVVSDESEDRTDEIVESIAQDSAISIKLVRQVPRKGKTSGLNLIVPDATGDIIVFSDANSLYAPDALTQLVKNFADIEVGYVTGKMVYATEDGSIVGDGCSSYMKYENWLREQETQVGSIVGVDGGIDAMRRVLYETLNADQLPDFVQPLKVAEKGYRVIYEPNALLKEEALDDPDREYSMRVRVSLRALWALHDMRQLLNPFKHGVFAFQLISHKLLRYLAFIPLIWVFIANLYILDEGAIYVLAIIGQLAFYGLAYKGKQHTADDDAPVYYTLPYYFTLLNVACLHATWRYIKGEKQVIWKPRAG
ncbi:glycosyltransferase family 2 protein [Alkalimarinus alittae]|uniref:Glycosyltransferase family 2 protein n=1 Tax=Alkalimarinus alittae TaxID=2961619 RepID=A0ABY6N796_9ALTE|nr:glycosyltransferase family 2 protein [Alkalimarinus alittae]UZE97966.1 glycosyltransferase family 2 protein [Alkalimarinus alittae]